MSLRPNAVPPPARPPGRLEEVLFAGLFRLAASIEATKRKRVDGELAATRPLGLMRHHRPPRAVSATEEQVRHARGRAALSGSCGTTDPHGCRERHGGAGEARPHRALRPPTGSCGTTDPPRVP